MKSTTNIAEITATHKAGKCLSEREENQDYNICLASPVNVKQKKKKKFFLILPSACDTSFQPGK